jgi:hypothetical protein
MIKGDVTCGGCGSRFQRRAWAELSIAERIEAVEVSRVVLNWPADFCVEVRRCPRCGREIAALRCMRALGDETLEGG